MSTNMFETIVAESIGFNIPIESVRAKTLGRLAVLADPFRMSANQGDLYHDAMWLRQNLQFAVNPSNYHMIFHYSTRETGTSIGTSYDHVSQGSRQQYRVTVFRENVARRGEPDFKYNIKIERLIRS